MYKFENKHMTTSDLKQSVYTDKIVICCQFYMVQWKYIFRFLSKQETSRNFKKYVPTFVIETYCN